MSTYHVIEAEKTPKPDAEEMPTDRYSRFVGDGAGMEIDGKVWDGQAWIKKPRPPAEK